MATTFQDDTTLSQTSQLSQNDLQEPLISDKASYPTRKRPSYGALWIVGVGMFLVGLMFGFVRGQWGMYTPTVYSQAIHKAYTSSYNQGVAIGILIGYQEGITAQTKHDKTLLDQLGTKYAQQLSQAKTTSYAQGQTDAQTSFINWWKAHCRYDSVISSNVCNASP